MPTNAKHSKKSKKRKGLKAFIIFILIAVIVGGGIFFVANYYDEAKINLEKSNYPLKYSELVEKYAKQYELEPSLVYAVIRTESGFDADAESGVGACGIMQVMPSSFEWLQQLRGEEDEYTKEDLFNPEVCIDYGCYLLQYFLDHYGDEKNAVAAYNAGFVVGEWLDNPEYSDDGKTLKSIPYPETEKYVEKVESAKEMYIKLYFS